MHPHFAFTSAEVLWTLTFASVLVLLVVLLGRERLRSFPWFSASIMTVALRLLTARVLADRLPRLTFAAIMITLADIGVVIGIMVLVEIARKAFARASRPAWIAGTLSLVAAGAAVLWFWGKWPAWATLIGGPYVALQIMELVGQKGELLIGALSIGLGLLVALFGRRYGAGWRTHTQRIMIGLSTAAAAQLGVQAILQIMSHHLAPKSRAEYEHILSLVDRITNANTVVYVAVLIWWIACLWRDEPGAAAAGELSVPESASNGLLADEPVQADEPAQNPSPADETK